MNIVVATDFSTRSHRALRQAGLLAQAGDAQLHIIHVVDQPADLIGMEREATRVLVEQIASVPELSGVRCNPVVTTGHAFDGILRAADFAGPELIVMGQHRKQALIDMFVGTTIERVVRGGRYPVLMVNNEGAAELQTCSGACRHDGSSGQCDPGRAGYRIDERDSGDDPSCFLTDGEVEDGHRWCSSDHHQRICQGR